MDLRKVKKLIELLEESAISEIEIHEGEESVRIARHSSGATQTIIQGSAQGHPAAHPLPQQQAVAPVETGHVIKAPMVGTLYRAPSPEVPPYVEVGQTIEPGQVICIIEAMKLMNEIKSEVRGRILEIVVENAEPVEFGQTMFIIEVL